VALSPTGTGVFDTVVDLKFFDNLDSREKNTYLAALHRATKPGAKLFMFVLAGYPSFKIILPANRFAITYQGETTYGLLIEGDVPMVEIHAVRRP
jgi:hypothetical protein